jgi:hypothetical protein
VGLHIFFLILYVAVSYIFPIESLVNVLLLAHCSIALLLDIRQKKKLYVMSTYYIGVMLATFANLLFVIKVQTVGIGENSMYHYIIPEYIDDATLLWAVGNSAIFAGYQFFSRNSLPPITVTINNKAVIRNLFYFIFVFTLMRVMGSAIRFSVLGGGFEKVLNLLAVIGILFYARLWTKENNNTYKNYAIVLCAMQVMIALGSFLRSDLITPFFSFFCGYFLGKGQLKYLFSYRVLPILIFVVVFAKFFDSLGGNRSNFLAAFTEGPIRDNTSYTYNIDEQDRGGVLQRSSNITQLTNVIKLTRAKGYYEGAASAPLLAAFIPRFIWPDKPQIQLGAWFALEIGVATINDMGRANNSINMTVPGQLFLDFGWLGLVLGCFLFGGLLSLFWNAAHFNDTPYNLTGTLWGGYMLLYAFGGMGADLQIVVSLISTYLAFLIIKKILVQHEKSTLNRAALARK